MRIFLTPEQAAIVWDALVQQVPCRCDSCRRIQKAVLLKLPKPEVVPNP